MLSGRRELLYQYLIHKYPRITARARMPRRDLSKIVSAYTNITRTGRDRLNKLFHHRIHFLLWKIRFDLDDAREIYPIGRCFKLDPLRHPDPRACGLQKARAERFDLGF